MHCLSRWGSLLILLSLLFSGFAEAQDQTKGKSRLVELPSITPARFSGDQKEVRLPADVNDLVVAGGGRYLILQLKKIRHLLVFDTVKMEIIKYLPMPSKECYFAAGAHYLIVLSPKKKIIERWDLSSFKKNQVPLPFSYVVRAISMGHASSGPLVFLVNEGSNRQSCKFMDPHTMQLLKLQQFIVPESSDEQGGSRRSRFRSLQNESQKIPNYLASIRPSANGQLVVTDRCLFLPASSTVEYRIKNNKGLPDALGNLIYSPKSLYSVPLNQLSPLGEWGTPFPAVQPGLFFTLYTRNGNLNAPQKGIVLQVENDPSLKFSLDSVDTELSQNRKDFKVPFEKRFTYIPAAGLMVQVPSIADRLILHKADISKLLEDSSVDYAYVTSVPQNVASLGKTYQYQLTVASNKKVKYELTNAPDQMSVSTSGLITWKVPQKLPKPVVPVEVQLELGSGKKTKYAFSITVPKVAERLVQKKQLAAALKEKVRQDQMKARQDQMKAQRDKQTQYMLKKLEEFGPKAKQAAEERALRYLKQMEEAQKRKQAEHDIRNWKDTSGNELSAQFIEIFAGKVKLRSNATGDYDIPLSVLSAEDQKYVKEITAAAREARKRSKAEDPLPTSPRLQMRQIYFGMQNVLLRTRGTFLNARSINRENKPLLSWRVNLLRFIGGNDLYNLFHHNEPWDSEYNKRLIPLMPAFYRTPNSKAGEGKTNLQVVTGERCLFLDKGSVGLSKVSDNLDQTVMLVEVPDKLAVEWTKPDDWEFTSESTIENLFGFQPGGFYALFADGAVKLISKENSLKEISKIFIRDDGGPVKLK